MIIESSGISVAYNCIFDVFTRRAYFLKIELRGEQDEVKRPLPTACIRTCGSKKYVEFNFLRQEKSHLFFTPTSLPPFFFLIFMASILNIFFFCYCPSLLSHTPPPSPFYFTVFFIL